MHLSHAPITWPFIKSHKPKKECVHEKDDKPKIHDCFRRYKYLYFSIFIKVHTYPIKIYIFIIYANKNI